MESMMDDRERFNCSPSSSTVSVRSSSTKTIISLSRSKECVELELTDWVPDLAVLGQSFRETSDMKMAHDCLLYQLQTSDNAADEMIYRLFGYNNEGVSDDVYSDMVDTVNESWHDINTLLILRKQILLLNLEYHSQADACVERMRALELLCEAPLPIAEPQIRKCLDCIVDVRRTMLECLLSALKAGQDLIAQLISISDDELPDSRPKQVRTFTRPAVAMVNQWLEKLHDRREQLEIKWHKRKLNLERQLMLISISCDLDLIETLLKERKENFQRSKQMLGNSPDNVQTIIDEHKKLYPDAKNIQEEVIRILKALERITTSSDEIKNAEERSYSALNAANEYLQSLNEREEILHQALMFFEQSQNILLQLRQIGKNLSNAASISERMSLMTTSDQISSEMIAIGNELLKYSSNATGIKHLLQEIESWKHSIATAGSRLNEENLEISQSVNEFYEQYNQMVSWYVNNIESFIQGHQDFGSGLTMAKNFLQLHEDTMTRMKLKDSDASSLSSGISSDVLHKLDEETRADVLNKLETLHVHRDYLTYCVRERVYVAGIFVEFHETAVALAQEWDKFDTIIKQQATDESLLQVEQSWLAIHKLHSQLSNLAKLFKNELHKTRDSYLDLKRAQLCVDTVLEHFANNYDKLEEKRLSWEESAFNKKHTRELWDRNMAESDRTIDWISKLDSQLYPVLNNQELEAAAYLEQIKMKMKITIPEIKKAEREISLRIKTAEELLSKGGVDNSNSVPPKLKELHGDIMVVIVNYTTLLDTYHAVLNKIKELEDHLVTCKSLINNKCNPSSEEELDCFKRAYSQECQTFHDMYNVALSECARLEDKIKQQEPEPAARSDASLVMELLNKVKIAWEKVDRSAQSITKQCGEQLQFERDFKAITTSIEELTSELTAIRQQYSISLSSAKSASLAFQYFEKTTNILGERMNKFLRNSENIARSESGDLLEMEKRLRLLKMRWEDFCSDADSTRKAINMSVQYFTLIEEVEEWFRDGTKLLVSIAKRSSASQKPEDYSHLLRSIADFLNPAQSEQESKIQRLTKLSADIFGDEQHSACIAQILVENNDMKESFATVTRELNNLLENSQNSAALKESNSRSDFIKVERLPSADENKVKFVTVEEKGTESSGVSSDTSAEDNNNYYEPKFIAPLEDEVVQENTKFTYACRISGNPPPTVRWLKNGVSIEGDPNYEFLYTDGHCSLIIENVTKSHQATFTCEAVNSLGHDKTEGYLKVEPALLPSTMEPPVIVRPVVEQTVTENSACEISCYVKGEPLPLVRWYKDDECVDNSPDYMITYNNGFAKLFIKNAQLRYQGTYRCVAYNKLGEQTTSAKIIVKDDVEAARFISHLQDIDVKIGEKVTLECEVIGKPFPVLTWYHNDQKIETGNRMSINGGSISLVIPSVSESDSGMYKLSAINSGGHDFTTCDVTLANVGDEKIHLAREEVKPTVRVPLADLDSVLGGEVTLECEIVGFPEPEVIWFCNNQLVKESDNIKLFFKGDKCTLRIHCFSKSDTGSYQVTARNHLGEVTSVCKLGVKCESTSSCFPPKFTELLTDVLIREGEEAVLECCVIGNPKPVVKWNVNNEEITNSDRIRISEDENGKCALRILEVVPSDRGQYTVKVTNQMGEAKSFSHLNVIALSNSESGSSLDYVHLRDKKESPIFVEMLTDRVAPEGSTVRFECIPVGKPAPKVKWLFNGEPVVGKYFLVSVSGNRQVLTVPQLMKHHSGTVTCIAENDAGTATTSAKLVVNDCLESEIESAEERNMSVSQLSKSFEMRRESLLQQSSRNNEPAEIKSDSYVSCNQSLTQQINNQEPTKMESKFVEEHHEKSGVSKSSSNSALPKSLSKSDLRMMRRHVAPRFLAPLNTCIVDEGSDVVFEAKIESFPDADVMWKKNGVDLQNEARISIENKSKSVILRLLKVHPNDAGNYTCEVSNDAGSATSSADLFVKSKSFPPVMSKRLYPASVEVGSRVVLDVEVSGTPDPLVTWYKNDEILATDSERYRLRRQGNNHALVIENVTIEDGAQYKVRASNSRGEQISTANLNVFESSANGEGKVEKVRKYQETSERISVQESKETRHSRIVRKVTAPVTSQNENIPVDEIQPPNSEKAQQTIEKILCKSENNMTNSSVQTSPLEPNFETPIYGTDSKNNNLENGDSQMTNWQKMNNNSGEKSSSIKWTSKGTPDASSQTENILRRREEIYKGAGKHLELDLTPGPTPEMGYVARPNGSNFKEGMAERMTKIAGNQRVLSPLDVPSGAVRVFPLVTTKERSKFKSTECDMKNKIRYIPKSEQNLITQPTDQISSSSASMKSPENTPILTPSQVEESFKFEKCDSPQSTFKTSAFVKSLERKRNTSISPTPLVDDIVNQKLCQPVRRNSYTRPLSVGDEIYPNYGRNETLKTSFGASFKDSLVRKTDNDIKLERGPSPEFCYAEAPSHTRNESKSFVRDEVLSPTRSEAPSYIRNESSSYTRNEAHSTFTRSEVPRYNDSANNNLENEFMKIKKKPSFNNKSSMAEKWQRQVESNRPKITSSFTYRKSVRESKEVYGTLPRGYKVADSSDYESEFERVISPKPPQNACSNYRRDNETFSPVMSPNHHFRRESGYQADTEDTAFSRHNTFPGKKFGNANGYNSDVESSYRSVKSFTTPRPVNDYRNCDQKVTQSFNRTSHQYQANSQQQQHSNEFAPLWRPSNFAEPENKSYRPVRPILSPSKSHDGSSQYSFHSFNEAKSQRPIQPDQTAQQKVTGYEKSFHRKMVNGAVREHSSTDNRYDYSQPLPINRCARDSRSVEPESSRINYFDKSVRDVYAMDDILKPGSPPKYLYSEPTTGSAASTPNKFNNDRMKSPFKTRTQQFFDDIVANVSHKQNELKEGGLHSESLFSPPVFGRVNSSPTTEHSFQRGRLDGYERNAVNNQSSAICFTTPLRSIAVVSDGAAKFECIVQADSTPDVKWIKDGIVLTNSDFYQISYRNGICRLLLPRTYLTDAGTYTCVASNKDGSCETSAHLTVSGEGRCYIKK